MIYCIAQKKRTGVKVNNAMKWVKAIYTAQKMKFFINDFFSKCDQIRSFSWIWSHLLKKSLMENFIFCSVSQKMLIGSTIKLVDERAPTIYIQFPSYSIFPSQLSY